jgi:hypothetical protein
MSVLKLSKKDITYKNEIGVGGGDDNEEIFKLKRSDISYDSAMFSSWEATNKASLNTLNNFYTRINKGEYLSSDDIKTYKSALDDYINTTNRLRGLNRNFGDGYSDEDEAEWNNSVTSMRGDYDNASKFYSSFKTETDYKDYLADYERREDLKKYDLVAGKAELDEAEAFNKQIEKARHEAGYVYSIHEQRQEGFVDPYETYQGLLNQWEKKYGTKTIEEMRSYYKEAERIQTGITLRDNALNAEDFDVYSQSGIEKGLDTTYKIFTTQNGGIELFSNVTNSMVIAYREDPSLAIKNTDAVHGRVYAQKALDYATYMTDEEYDIYTYWFGKDEAKAEEYLKSIEETINGRKAGTIVENIGDSGFLKMAFGFGAGIEQFGEGVKNLFSDEDYYVPTSTQMASAEVRESLGDSDFKIFGSTIGQIGYDLFNTTGNMLPSILVSYIPVVGQVAGTASMGISAAGNAKAEMINLGYTKEQATSYGLLVGASEATLQYALGGISKLGGKVSGKAIGKFVDKVDNAFAKTAIKLGGSMASEGLEEAIQSVLEPAFKSFVTGEKYEVDWGEVLYSGLLGALSAGVLEGVPSAVGSAIDAKNTYSYGKDFKKNGGDINRVATFVKDHGDTLFSADSVAYKLAGKVNEKTGAYQIGKLLNEVQGTITESNRADIIKSLESKGVRPKEAQLYANALEAVVAGHELTESQIYALNANEAVSKTLMDVIINPNSTVNQRMQGYTEAISMIQNGGEGVKTAQNRTATPQNGIPSTEDGSVIPQNGAVSAENGSVAPQTGIPSTDGETTQVEANANSTAGKTTYEGEEVSVKEISSIKDGEVIVRLEDGREVNAREVNFSSEREALVYEAVADMSPEKAMDFIDSLKAGNVGNGNNQISLEHYLNGFNEAYRYGLYGVPKAEMSRNGFSVELTEQQRDIAHNRGRVDAMTIVKKKQAVLDEKEESAKNAQTTKKKGKVIFDKVNKNSLNERQSASIKALDVVAEALGIDIHIFESLKDKNGKRIGANGWYDSTDNSIHIDLYAGATGESTMLFTAAHELTHFIRQWSPAKFKTFADFLLEQYGAKGVSVEELIQRQIAKAKNNGRDIDYDTAYEEVIADSCEAMLTDSNAIEKLAKLKAKDETLWGKIKSFISDLVAKIKSAYDKLNPDSVEANHVREMLDVAEQLQALWTDALVDAGEAYSAIGDMVQVDTASESVSPMLSERTWTESEYVQEREKTAKKIAKELNISVDVAKAYIDDINGVARLIADDRARLDYEPNLDEKATVLKKNSEYKFSVDMSTLCAKRLLFTGTFDAIQRQLPNTAFDSDDIVRLRQMMVERGYEVACGICYVESTRREIGTITQDFINSYKEAQKTGKPITRVNSEGKIVELKKTKEQKETTVDKTTDKFFAEKDYTPTLADLNTTDIDLVKKEHPLVYEAYLNFMNARGQAKPKLLETRAEYKGEILKHFKTKSAVTARNNAGGLRLQSFSDFEVPHLIDMMQITMDMARVGLKAQAYTKVPNFAEAFGNTGIKINLSLIAKDSGLDSNGKLIFDDTEGINHKEAFRLRDKFSKNVGTILVGKNDAHIVAAMADPRIDYIIPFHKSSWKESLYDALGLTGYADYTDFQNEKYLDASRGKVKNFDPSEYWDFSKMGDENAQIYLEKCREDGRIPKFPQFQGYEGYWKLLIDFKMYDNDGAGSPQEVVQPIFDNATNEKILNEYKGGHRSFPEAKDVVSDFVKEYKSEKKFSDRDSAGNQLSKEQQEFFKDSKVRDSKGRLQVVYHGTTSEFNTFKRGDIGYHFGSYAQARNRLSYQGGKKRYIKAYLDIKNPLVVEHDSGSWHGNYAAGMLLTWGDFDSNPEAVEKLQEIANMYDTRRSDVELKNFLKSLGYDGVQYLNTHESDFGKESYSYIAFESNQVKEVTNLNPTENPDIRYSDREFVSNINQWDRDGQPDGETFVLGSTGNVLQGLGAIENDIYMLGDKIKSILVDHPEMTLAEIKKIPQILENPALILKSRNVGRGSSQNTRLVIFGTIKAKNGMPILSVLDLRPSENHFIIEDWQKVTSAYTKTNDPISFVRNSDVLYAEKKRATSVLRTIGFQMPIELTRSGFIGSISYKGQNVNIFGENFSKIFSESQTKYSDRDLAPTFYSQMGKVVDGMKQDKFGTNSVIPMLRGRGVKAEEIRWSGIATFLEGKKSVTKQELLEFIQGSQLQIGEQMSNTATFMDEDGNTYTDKEFKDKAYAMAKEQGIDQDRVKFVLDPDDGSYVAYAGSRFNGIILEAEANESSMTRWSEYKLDGGENYREIVFTMPNSTYTNRAMKGHWGDEAEGVLAHARIQDFVVNGKKMLFIEEIQSDWHNEGHSKGYSTKEYEDAVDSHDKLYNEYKKMDLAFHKYVRSNEFMTDPEDVRKKKHDWLRRKAETAQKKYLDAEKLVNSLKENGAGDTPDAPFKDTYHEFVLKRLLRMAAEEGYDSIGWTPADIQSERWSEDYAEGYRIEYDQDMPKFLKKYGRQWGATVGKTAIEVAEHSVNGVHYDAEKVDVWSMDLTDSMKDSVLHEGQVLYSDRVTDKETLNFLENQEHVTVYRAMQLIDGKLYPPMNAYTYDKDGKKVLVTPSEIGAWEQSVERPDLIDPKTGKFKLDKGKVDGGKRGTVVPAAYNPYIHTSLSMLNDQFTSAYTRSNLVVVKGVVPKSELTSGYKAQFAKDSVGETEWHSGVVSTQLPESRKVILSRWFKPIEVMDNDVVAQNIKKMLGNTGIEIPYNVVSPKLRRSLENIGVPIGEGRGIRNLPSKNEVKYSDRDPDSVSNRSLLANALESTVQNDIERNKLQQYKEKIELINSEEAKLHELREQIKEISFSKGTRDTEKLRSLQFEANQTANRINTYDRQLLTLEASKPLKDVLEREKKLAYKKAEQKGKDALSAYREKTAKTTKELMTRYQESRAKATEGRHKTEYRHKIKDVVSKLNQLLLRPTKDKHIKEGLRTAVAEALSVINMDTVGAEERIAKYNDLIAKTSDPDMVAELTKTRDRIELQGEALKDKLTALQTAYEKIKNSTDPDLKNAYQEPVMNAIKNVADMVGNTSIRDMNLTQLEAVYEMYSMILHTVRTANKAFKAKKGETITQISEAVNDEIRKVGKEKFKRNPLAAWLRKTGWTILKPFTAFRTIGSDTFTGLYNNLRAGEDTYYLDVNEARTFIQGQYEKHNFKSWDQKQTKTFTAKSGKTFTLTLEQMMSLYAYSRRNQAYDHIIEGGIVLEDSVIETKNKLGLPVKYKVDTKSAFNISEETLQEICDSLTAEQKGFVEDMQAYLSDVMGAKGNEISMELLGVKLFKEKFYFPLKSSKYYMGFKPEEAGEIKLKNPAFSKETVQHANNPVVLKGFTDVWATHINDMSMYHAFVLPLEDFTRVYNYKTRTDALLETMSTEATIANAYGEGATQYIRNFLKSLNGGVRIDSVDIADKAISLTKKGAVLASASVMIQQPSAIMRAMALINPIHFVTTTHKSINLVKHKRDWAELKTYAPIAGIKEMGGYDIGMGQGTVDWIKDQSTIKDKVDDALGKAPAFMDEITWVGIWNAVKRETASKNKGMDVNSEAFLKKAGERFTEVVTLTQVYDSVFSRSDIMRNANPLAKMLTSFMAEPSTTLNMFVDSFIQGKRTGKVGGFVKITAGTTGAITAAIVFNATLKSIITAMRDDDEDESYAEKYLGAFVGNVKDDLNPLSYIPFVKDIVSIFNGYDVERMDMALFSDLKNAIDAFDSDSKSEYEKWSGLVGAISAFFGVPVKNVERDIRGAYNTIKSFFEGEKTTDAGIWNSIREGWTGDEISNTQQLYEAYLKGDEEQIKRVEGRFEDKSEIEAAIRKALRENDPRIHEAAQAVIDGNHEERIRLTREIVAEGHFKQDLVVGAINAELTYIRKKMKEEENG